MATDFEDMAGRAKPCPFCGERLVVKKDHLGKWLAHKKELGPCCESVAQIHDDGDLKDWNTRAPETAYLARSAVIEAADSIRVAMTAPSVLYRPRLFPDGTMWCALLGEDLAEGVAGFGETPQAAMAAFDAAWINERTPKAALVQLDRT